jgi:crossover junction endodeoxyribonuclease RusA
VNFVKLSIPLIPPGFNHYIRHTRTGRHYVTKEARAFKDAVAVLIDGEVIGKEFEVEAWIYLGEGMKGDTDGFGKLILDGLAEAGVFVSNKGEPLSDAHVTDVLLHKRRDADNPRTEIEIKALR